MKLEKGFYIYCNNGKNKHKMFVDDNNKVWSIRRTCRYEYYLCDFDVEVYGAVFETTKLIKDFENDKDETHFEFKGLELNYSVEHYSVLDYKHYLRDITLKWNNETQKIDAVIGEDIFLYQEECAIRG